jgi:hypothetical protein
MVTKENVSKLDNGLVEVAFMYKGVWDDAGMHKVFERVVMSDVWRVGRVRVTELDDYDAPIDRNVSYESRVAVKDDMDRISDIQIEGFVVHGKYGNTDVMLIASCYGQDNLRVVAPPGFDAEGFLNKLGIS